MPMIDLHCDTIMKLYENKNSQLFENNFQIDLKRLQQNDFLLQTFAIFLDKKQYPNRKETALQMYQRFIKELEKMQLLLVLLNLRLTIMKIK
ncbi:dipeptidase [Enterococcus cecorum]|nr:hypothetical protein AA986_04915 [Enterococcus cecorum]CAI3423864.1 dipeptidase [Enterococcus cecorum]